MTLTETSSLTKKVFIFGAIFLFVAILGWLGFQYYYYKIYLPSLPKKIEKPEIKWGPLPKLKLPQTGATSSNFSYTLDTETGSLPNNLPKILKVYPVTPLSTDLLALDRARALADKLDFKDGPEMLSSTQYRFTDQNNGEFIINLDNGNFKYKHNESSESATLTSFNQFISKDRTITEFKSFLGNTGLLKDQLQNGRTQAAFNRTTIENSDSATVSIWQEDIDTIPIITPTFKQGLIVATVTKSGDEIRKYNQLNYIYWPIDYENNSTYPLMSADDAFALLKNGEGSVIIESPEAKASITKVYLGYFLSDEYLEYLQPVYVFEGPAFLALVPAISPDQVAH